MLMPEDDGSNDRRASFSAISKLADGARELEDRPFQTKEVAEWLRNASDTTLTLYWSSGLVPAGNSSGCATVNTADDIRGFAGSSKSPHLHTAVSGSS